MAQPKKNQYRSKDDQSLPCLSKGSGTRYSKEVFFLSRLAHVKCELFVPSGNRVKMGLQLNDR